LPALYLTGLFDLIFLGILSMTFSLYAKTVLNGRYLVFFSAAFILWLKIILGQYTVIPTA
jgi:hypothetical protein